MTYINPKIYNKQNLKPTDKFELDFWKDNFENAVSNAQFNIELEMAGIPAIGDIVKDVVEAYNTELRTAFYGKLQEVLVSIIDGYDDDDIKEYEEWETYDFEAEEGNDI